MNSALRIGGALTVTAAMVVAMTACEDKDSKDKDSKGTAAAKAVPASLTGQRLDWHTCAAPTPAQGGGKAPGKGWECATMKAPRDYAKPQDGSIGVQLIRKKTTDPKKRIGSLVYNFGGPGGSGIQTMPALGEAYGTLNQRYDLVSFDPRGVGESEGVKCLSDKETDAMAERVDSTPDTPAEEKAAQAASKKYVQACARNSGRMLPHVDTVSTARDMDLMRQVLGDKKLNYFGISYGTELGGVYAHLFPKRVGRSVLDAVVDPTQDERENGLAQAKGFQLALNNFMKECATAGKECPTGKGGAEGSRKLTDFFEKLDKKPLPTKSGRKLTEGQAVTGVVSSLYSKESWVYLMLGLSEAMENGTGDMLLGLADSYTGRDGKGRYSNSDPANRAVNCVDDKARYTEKDVEAALPEFRKASPVFGETVASFLTSCSGWPVKGETDGPEVSAKGAAPIVVIGNTGDPATPYEGARKMATALGKGVGINVTLKGEGHGGYNTGNKCLRKAVDGYLLNGKVPAMDTTCS
ncbi:alpha/beta fold hydrolase [Streptomyces sp. NA04227]|uniref:alpha/beta hydrolase n=1 Tax=Streptomyces sp. NA04227 TaxID=2742136 RepID=UPI001590E14F|nr:alpha/beta hydrolase [Streptomyces sp. NA04227]QKW08799.1 alpha/beta fold hydrolase [Streptomyces sp. NA04227]